MESRAKMGSNGANNSPTHAYIQHGICGSPPGVMMAATLSFNAKIGLVDF